MLHTEPLLFVDHKQAQVFESNVFLQQAMRANHHVDFARGQAGNHALGFGRAHETRKHFYFYWVGLEAFTKRGHVLRCQQRGWHEYRSLFAILDGFESGANRHFGFAETHIATHETIHRAGTVHVLFHSDDCFKLIGGFNEWKRGFHFRLPRCVGAKRVPRRVQSSLVQHHEFLGNHPQVVAHPLFDARKICTTHLVERWRVAAHILPHEVDLIAEHEQAAVGITQVQEVAFDPVEFAPRHAFEHADAMHVVHHMIARFEIFEHRGGPTAACAPTTREATTRNFGFGRHHDRNCWQHETLVQLLHHDRDHISRKRRLGYRANGGIYDGDSIRCEFVSNTSSRLVAVIGEHDLKIDLQ